MITLAIRTPLTKGKKGGLKDTHLDGIIFKILEQVVRVRTSLLPARYDSRAVFADMAQKSRIDPQMVEDICLGNVSDAKAAYYVRAACLAAGFPNTTSAYSTNRFCSSGLKATQDIANQIITGSIEIGVAIGAESMSDGGDRLTRPFVDEIINSNQDAADCLQPMGQTSENVGKDFEIPREAQDKYAAESVSYTHLTLPTKRIV